VLFLAFVFVGTVYGRVNRRTGSGPGASTH
jgi:hypothetical protein